MKDILRNIRDARSHAGAFTVVAVVLGLTAFCAIDPFELQARKIALKLKTPDAKQRGSDEHVTSGSLSMSRADTLLVDSIREFVKFSRFEKAVSSAKEAFLITNRGSSQINSIRVRIDYYTMGGEMIHSREISKEVAIPGGATRMVEIRSFDSQKSFYHHTNTRPRREATPFKTVLTLTGITLTDNSHKE